MHRHLNPIAVNKYYYYYYYYYYYHQEVKVLLYSVWCHRSL